MSRRHEAEGRTIHPRALKELGEEACIVALGVARDLRSGVIPPEEFDMGTSHGSACCIVGHLAVRLYKLDPSNWRTAFKQAELHVLCMDTSLALTKLFSGEHPSNPQLAADAIERFVYGGSDEPWKVPAMTGG